MISKRSFFKWYSVQLISSENQSKIRQGPYVVLLMLTDTFYFRDFLLSHLLETHSNDRCLRCFNVARCMIESLFHIFIKRVLQVVLERKAYRLIDDGASFGCAQAYQYYEGSFDRFSGSVSLTSTMKLF